MKIIYNKIRCFPECRNGGGGETKEILEGVTRERGFIKGRESATRGGVKDS